jgi:hypothetical protein
MTVLVVLLLLALPFVGAVLAVRLGRARSSPRPAAFPCKVRPKGGPGDKHANRWPRSRWRGAWAHEVLLLDRGVLLPRTAALAVRMPEEALRDAGPGEVNRLGPDPVVVLLRLDDDSLIEVAAPHARRVELVGPFMAAAIPGLPRGPREQRHLGR